VTGGPSLTAQPSLIEYQDVIGPSGHIGYHPLNESAPAVEIHDLGKRFGDRVVLEGLNLSIPSGAFVAVIGQSGCGKSTLLRLIAGLDEPTSGEIHLYGELAEGLRPEVRVIFQEPRLLPWKRVRDNVALGLGKAAREHSLTVLDDVGLLDRADEWPSVLSGGQRQRVALARALASEPRILLLDEPLGALDSLTRFEMQLLLERVWREHGFTALLITHDVVEAVSLADFVVVIDQGHIVLNETVSLPRPRDHSHPEFVRLTAQILDQVRHSVR